MVKKGVRLTPEHRRRIGEGLRRNAAARNEKAREAMSSDDNPKAHEPHRYSHPHAGQNCRCIKLCVVCKLPESNLIHHGDKAHEPNPIDVVVGKVQAGLSAEAHAQMDRDTALREDLRRAINRNSREGRSNTPDHILAEYLMQCLQAYEAAHNNTQVWMGSNPTMGYREYETRTFGSDGPVSRFSHPVQEDSDGDATT